MFFLEILIVAICGYFLGSIPFAVVIARRHGVDILREGSGNPGATNVRRVIGPAAGNVCFALDALKGFAAAAWPVLFLDGPNHPGDNLGVVGLVAAILGHSFSFFIQFRGGKGVATTIGGLLALSPLTVAVGALLWVVVFYLTRYVSLASIVLAVSLPVTSLISHQPPAVDVLCLVLMALILVRHRENIRRLREGTEHRWTRS